MTLTPHPDEVVSVNNQLRALNNEYRDTQSALMQAQHSVSRALKLNEENYHRKRKAIIRGNGHNAERDGASHD